MLRINQLKLEPGHSEEDLISGVLCTLKIKREDLLNIKIQKQSLDARKKPDVFFQYTIDVSVRHEEKVYKKCKNKVQRVSDTKYQIPEHGTKKMLHRPVVVGAGPAGLFCTLLLAQEGYAPLLIERGAPVEERLSDVENFWNTGHLNPASNVQFGEGGAGTFSDGKLNTLVKDAMGRNRFVLETFVRFGAPAQILYQQKPHIGTDILAEVVRRMREEILKAGGEIHFHSQLTDIKFSESKITSLIVNNTEEFKTEALILAIGHSARDTFEMLYANQIPMQPKSFAVGVRIEHPQSMIQLAQYGEKWADKLPAAAYKLTEKLENGRGVYTFCMCPGGYVVNASSEEKRLAVNGMSYHDRAGKNANSAVIVTVTPEDFPDTHPLSGVRFQRELEEKAYREGEGKIPVQCFQDFRENRTTTAFGEIIPQTKGAFRMANVRNIFPEVIADSIVQGIEGMDKKIKGFARADALISGVESRTSSPLRILRDENFESTVNGLYPCGEGAGYAGGITSAAMDGIKTAEAIIRKYAPYIVSSESSFA